MILAHETLVIGIPVFNEQNYIAQTISSLRNQSLRDFAVLIVDNASTDDSWDIIQASIARDTRFTAHRHDENIGALKKGLADSARPSWTSSRLVRVRRAGFRTSSG